MADDSTPLKRRSRPPPAPQVPHLPHERDQIVGQAGRQSRAVMRQASRDLEAGQVDTDLRATPGLDAQRRRKLVPQGR